MKFPLNNKRNYTTTSYYKAEPTTFILGAAAVSSPVVVKIIFMLPHLAVAGLILAALSYPGVAETIPDQDVTNHFPYQGGPPVPTYPL